MRLTHLGHACLLVETADARILVDPGSFSADFTALSGLDAILLTHQHPDHVDEHRLPALLAVNPTASVLAEPDTAAMLRDSTSDGPRASPFVGGESTTVGGVTIEGVGQQHALIHGGVPRVGNTGFVLSAVGEPTLFHPGDAYDAEPGRQVDVLALPLSAPWTAIQQTLSFADRISPRWEFPIHDALLTSVGRTLYLTHVRGFAPEGATVVDLSDGVAWEVG